MQRALQLSAERAMDKCGPFWAIPKKLQVKFGDGRRMIGVARDPAPIHKWLARVSTSSGDDMSGFSSATTNAHRAPKVIGDSRHGEGANRLTDSLQYHDTTPTASLPGLASTQKQGCPSCLWFCDFTGGRGPLKMRRGLPGPFEPLRRVLDSHRAGLSISRPLGRAT